MKDRVSEMQKNTLAFISVACFLVLCFVTFLNTYRMLLLEAEVQELRETLEKYSSVKGLDDESLFVEKLNQYITRERRSVLDEDSSSERNGQRTQNLSRLHILSEFKGVGASELPSFGSSSSLNTIYPNDKGASKRTSRIMHFDDQPKRVVKKSALRSLDSDSFEFNAGSSESEFPIIRDEEVVTRRARPRMQTLDERHPRTGRIKPLPSIHLSGDTSRYVLGTHQNFKGNGHLRHLQSVFVDWVPSSWVDKIGMMSHFGFEEGYLTIKESGLYLIYAQIYYLDEHDLNGYRVYKNDNAILQCTISLHSITRAQKGNTCYTAGVEYVAEGDRISLGDILSGHYSLFEPGKSFFGVVKLGDARVRI